MLGEAVEEFLSLSRLPNDPDAHAVVSLLCVTFLNASPSLGDPAGTYRP